MEWTIRMSSRVSEEVADLAYTCGYFPQISPRFLGLCALSKGVPFEPGPRLRYLELGFGQGVSLAIHAASNVGEFWGNDINPTHVAHARDLVAASGASANTLPDSFEQLCARTDLPQFDLIALHGIWSWVSDQDRARITDLARRCLAPGGLLYVSYNCAAGWSPAIELRHLLLLYAEKAMPRDMPVTTKVEHAFAFARNLASADAAYFRANPTVVAQLQAVAGSNRTYLAHEFLGEHWRPMSIGEVANQLQGAGLEFLASAFLLEHSDRFTLNEAGRALIAPIEHPVLREMATECFINPQFRQDIFVKQPVALSADERLDLFRSRNFVLTTPRLDVPSTIPGPRAPILLDPMVYPPLLDALADCGHAPKTLADIEAAIKSLSISALVDAIIVLAAAGYVLPASGKVSEQAREHSKTLNDHLCRRAQRSGDINVLASPVLGAGVRVGRAQQMYLLARQEGAASPSDWARYAWSHIEASGDRPFRNGRRVESASEAIDVLAGAAASFEATQLPILKSCGVA